MSHVLDQHAAEVAARLGREWMVRPDQYPHATQLARRDGAALRLELITGGRIRVTGILPAELTTRLNCQITATLDQGCGHVAQQITTRLLPTYLPEHARLTSFTRKRERETAEEFDQAARLAALLPGARSQAAHADWFSIGLGQGALDVSTDYLTGETEVRIVVSRITPERAAAMLRALVSPAPVPARVPVPATAQE